MLFFKVGVQKYDEKLNGVYSQFPFLVPFLKKRTNFLT